MIWQVVCFVDATLRVDGAGLGDLAGYLTLIGQGHICFSEEALPS